MRTTGRFHGSCQRTKKDHSSFYTASFKLEQRPQDQHHIWWRTKQTLGLLAMLQKPREWFLKNTLRSFSRCRSSSFSLFSLFLTLYFFYLRQNTPNLGISRKWNTHFFVCLRSFVRLFLGKYLTFIFSLFVSVGFWLEAFSFLPFSLSICMWFILLLGFNFPQKVRTFAALSFKSHKSSNNRKQNTYHQSFIITRDKSPQIEVLLSLLGRLSGHLAGLDWTDIIHDQKKSSFHTHQGWKRQAANKQARRANDETHFFAAC